MILLKQVMVHEDGRNESFQQSYHSNAITSFQRKELSCLHILCLEIDKEKPVNLLKNEYMENELQKKILINPAAKAVKKKTYSPMYTPPATGLVGGGNPLDAFFEFSTTSNTVSSHD
jgi:hypothetical protein